MLQIISTWDFKGRPKIYTYNSETVKYAGKCETVCVGNISSPQHT